jgi:hypothetical protein
MLPVDKSSREVAWEHALTARMNVFYYQRLMARWFRWDRRRLGRLLVEYTAHHHRFSMLYQFGCTDDELNAALDLFAATEMREAKDHPSPDAAMLEKCRREVLESIGG